MSKAVFEATVEGLSIGDRPEFTAAGTVVCLEWGIWPEQLLGYIRAGESATYDYPPLSTGRCMRPLSHGISVQGRRFAWHLAHQFTEAPVDEIAVAFGGHSPNTVQPWLPDLRMFETTYYYWNSPVAQKIGELSASMTALLGQSSVETDTM